MNSWQVMNVIYICTRVCSGLKICIEMTLRVMNSWQIMNAIYIICTVVHELSLSVIPGVSAEKLRSLFCWVAGFDFFSMILFPLIMRFVSPCCFLVFSSWTSIFHSFLWLGVRSRSMWILSYLVDLRFFAFARIESFSSLERNLILTGLPLLFLSSGLGPSLVRFSIVVFSEPIVCKISVWAVHKWRHALRGRGVRHLWRCVTKGEGVWENVTSHF